jgi:hypothetical protein
MEDTKNIDQTPASNEVIPAEEKKTGYTSVGNFSSDRAEC